MEQHLELSTAAAASQLQSLPASAANISTSQASPVVSCSDCLQEDKLVPPQEVGAEVAAVGVVEVAEEKHKVVDSPHISFALAPEQQPELVSQVA